MADQFIVSARKYRPTTWESVVGQGAITATLRNAIATNQIAQAYLFCGPRGVGKTTCARLFAKEINKAEDGVEQDLSFNIFELDAASNNSVDDIRTITDQVRIPPQTGRYRVYIIDEVHMLSQQAFNAFLKTLEEPPPHAIFILATTEKHKIIPTILSRCQIFDFNRISVSDIASHLAYIAEQEHMQADPEGLHIIAQKADGALRDALSILDQVAAFSEKVLSYENVIKNLNVLDYENYFKVVKLILEENIPDCLLLFGEILDHGFDGHHFIIGLGEHFRNLLVSKDEKTVQLMETSDSVRARYVEQAHEADLRLIIKALELINHCDVQYRTSKNQRLLVELTLMQLCSIKYNEAEKKKSNFRIKPFIGGGLAGVKRPAASGSQDAPSAPQRVVESIFDRNKARTAEKPLARSKGVKPAISMTLTDLLKESEVAVEEGQEELARTLHQPTESYTIDEFREVWKAFAERLKEAENFSLYSTLTARAPRVTADHAIQLEINNSVQEADVINVRAEMLEFIKNRLKNHLLHLELIMVKDDPEATRLYTDKDKYDAMLKVNPALEHFRKRLNLDLEF
ncbi:MAG: DNA polymerase III subunit gamma/tau [Flavobacteriales bacterium]|nr:DNA polymerase III subunit gamma/tau [Flavobacteriales bacterium]